ncbi:hypothetical protein [Saccharospirillum mangrovi]|uniref:hypothetical protein n=1 Tax=Saccharospirillum mangrovi TaxID=2161747 RepID=UPI000D3C439D|nr:hypothetical protein [Saccharospirillum mangrovi]
MLYSFLRDTLRFFGHHWIPLTVITAGLGLVFELFVMLSWSTITTENGFPWAAYLLQWLGTVWTSAAVILYLDRALAGEYLAPVTAWRRALVFVLPLAGLQLLVTLGISLGLVLLVAPGIYIAVKLALSSFYLVLDRQPIFTALQSSWRGSTGYGWTLLGGYLLFYGVIMLLMQMITYVLVSETDGYGMMTVFIGVLFKPLAALVQIFGFRVYSDSGQSS